MITALYTNPNYDGEKGNQAREKIIETLEDQFSDVVRRLYNGGKSKHQKEKEAMEANPFFQAMERGLKEQGVPTLEELEGTESDRPVPDIPDEKYEVDQR